MVNGNKWKRERKKLPIEVENLAEDVKRLANFAASEDIFIIKRPSYSVKFESNPGFNQGFPCYSIVQHSSYSCFLMQSNYVLKNLIS